MNILAIGGSGWIGTAFTKKALAQGHGVTILSRGNCPIPQGVEHIQLDRNNSRKWDELVMDGRGFTDGGDLYHRGGRFDYTIDFMGRGQKQGVQMLGIDGWQKPNLFISGDHIYSPRQSSYPLVEGTSRYQSRYDGGEKYQMEWLFNSGSSKRFTNVLRPAYLYGSGKPLGPLPPHLNDPDLVNTIMKEGRLYLPLRGKYLIQPLFLDDFVQVILDLLEKPDQRGVKYNVPGPELIEAGQFYSTLADILGVKLHILPLDEVPLLVKNPCWEQYMRHRILDDSALKTSGLTLPCTGVRAGLERILNK
jgi:nucleoside-diphosphate-sugar epimerase